MTQTDPPLNRLIIESVSAPVDAQQRRTWRDVEVARIANACRHGVDPLLRPRNRQPVFALEQVIERVRQRLLGIEPGKAAPRQRDRLAHEGAAARQPGPLDPPHLVADAQRQFFGFAPRRLGRPDQRIPAFRQHALAGRTVDLEEAEQHFRRRVLGNERAPPLPPDDEALLGQRVQRLADRALADAQFVGQRELARQHDAGRPGALLDPLAQQLADLRVERTGAGALHDLGCHSADFPDFDAARIDVTAVLACAVARMSYIRLRNKIAIPPLPWPRATAVQVALSLVIAGCLRAPAPGSPGSAIEPPKQSVPARVQEPPFSHSRSQRQRRCCRHRGPCRWNEHARRHYRG